MPASAPYNRARTLLLNRSGSSTPGADFPGEEAVPAEFKELKLPGHLQKIRNRLFGVEPDRFMLNYRLKQYLALLHATELEQYVLELDSRVTYLSARETTLARPETYRPKINRVSGDEGDSLSVLGSPSAPDITGRCRQRFSVDVLSTDTVEVKRLTDPKSWIFDLELGSNGLTNQFELPGAGYRVRLNTDNPGASWRVELFLRPQWGLDRIVNGLRGIGEPVLLSLFGAAREEPYRTFHNLWRQHPELPYQLGGLLLAVVWRTEEIRTGAAT